MAISSIGGTSFNPQAMAAQMASRVMKAADQDGSGTLSKAELSSFKDSQGGRGPDVDQVFASYNTTGDGELTQAQLTSSLEAEGARMKAKGGAPPPQGGASPQGGGGPQASPGSSSSGKTTRTDPRDLNQDGKVTEIEILRYAILHPDTTGPQAKPASEDAEGPGSMDLYG